MRKLATAAAVSLALASGGAFGLGLGEIEMQSALNQPMDAEIPLTSVQPGELEGMIVQLASPEAFTRAGIDRSAALTGLRFTVDQSSGTPVIKIESSQPVIEPFLNFLVEVDWPQGRVVREYTVLLDPPVFLSPSASERNSAADQPALVQGGDAALVVPTPIERSTAALDEGFEVELFDLEVEEVDPVLSLDEATSGALLSSDGESVSLDGLSDDNLLPGGEGNVVSLSDLNAPNTDAVAELEAEAVAAFSLDDVQVSVADSDEVSDNVVIGPDGQPVGGTDSNDGSTIVSLDDLEEPAEIAEPTDVAEADTGSAASEVTVGSGDTLFEIAQSNAPAGVSVQQMMMAMLAANESSFINSNINLVRAGSILRVPDSGEANRLTQAQALAAIGDQNQLWQDYRDSIRGAASTQIAQNLTPTADVEADVDEGSAASETIETAGLDTDTSVPGLSSEAQAILDSAREEVNGREELSIVADVLSSDTTASATADETTDSDASALVGEVNRKLQMAREELSATRLRSTDLSDQASELEDTSKNLDALVALRQNEIARLEAQLVEAREGAVAEAEAEAQAAEAEAEAQAADAALALAVAEAEAEADALEEAANAASDVAEQASEALDSAGNVVADAAGDLASDAQSTADEVLDSGTNALTEAGETLNQVELFDEGATAGVDAQDAATAAAVTVPVVAKTWYQEFLEDPKRLAIAGLGGLGLLGVLGTLLFRRKRRDPEESMLDSIDEFEFNNEVPAVPDTVDANLNGRFDNTSEFAAAGLAAGAAGVAATGAAAASFGQKSDDAFDELGDSFADRMDDVGDSTLALGASDQVDPMPSYDAPSADGGDVDQDDTIAEVDVYLAYGLHGQAEELLSKAIEREPGSDEYASKLLQTYHAQGNGESFHGAATDYHQRFGGEHNPKWPAIAAMGAELQPGNALYALSAGHSSGNHSETEIASENEFMSAGNSDTESVSREFGTSEPMDMQADESHLMDESLDPAFAFDEGDLEATGDFSAVVEELAAENDDGSLDFPGFDDAGAAANEALSQTTNALDSSLDDNMLVDELDGLTDSIDDLTLDLDQLSGDLELDSSELLDSDLSSLELPDLSADNDLLLDSSGALGEGGDEMDTLMDLAKAYIDLGDKDSASSALDEIVKSGNPDQVVEAETLLRNIS